MLKKGELRSGLDFSLMLLLRAWHAPWTPESHISFQPEFRRAAHTIMLATSRLSMPNDVGYKIIEFLRRDFWPDERAQCWNHECQFNQVVKLVEMKKIAEQHNGVSRVFLTCPKCGVPNYCSESCRKTDWADYHRQLCNAPPNRIPGLEEERLCTKVFDEHAFECCPSATPTHVSENDDQEAESEMSDDEGSWEDIDSDEDDVPEETTPSQIVFKFFKEQTYEPRGVRF